MQRGIFKVSLCLFSLLFFQAGAVPWREKNALRIASTLPKRLIDSIMAQGNWNILFQEGPFSEFQRQMAIGGHFALRGEVSQAEFYYRRAETALDIAYASLRSRFEWPRSPLQLKADELPWGENRDTFRDYLLCRLQLYIESGLAGHDLGKVGLERLAETVARTESQMSQSLKDKDADLDNFVRLLRGSNTLRATSGISQGLRATRFLELSAAIPPSARNYWRRRTVFFQIQEHLYYGNLGIARALTDFLFSRHGDQSDPLAIARFWIQSSDFVAAADLLEKEFASSEVRSGENYPDFLRISETLQNLLVWQRQYLRAAEIAQVSRDLLNGFIAGNQVPREEFVSVRRSAANQKLRSEMLHFLATGKCPSTLQLFEGSEPETEWRIRERLFYEKCGLSGESDRWQKWLAEKSLTPEAREIIRFVAGTPTADKIGNEGPALVQYLSLYHATAKAGKKSKRADMAISMLDAAGRLHADLVFLDWGLLLPDDGMVRALRELKEPLRANEAASVFSALHRQYARRHLRGSSLFQFSAADAGELRGEIYDWVLGGDSGTRTSSAAETGGDLVYADSAQTIAYQPGVQNSMLQVLGNWQTLDSGQRSRFFRSGNTTRLYGMAPLLAGPDANAEAILQIAPLFSSCTDCTPAGRNAARLLLGEVSGNGWKSTRADLADIFSTQLNLKARPECSFTPGYFQDTLITQSAASSLEYPCNLALENLILEAGTSRLPKSPQLLWAVAGRQNSVALLLPDEMNAAARTAFLFDFLQRRNRREVPARQAFNEARRRAEKSFPPGSGIEAVRIYAPAD
ncbi:MAG TPA: hypothetical protein PKI36_08470 [Turneriella sp.]|nr:hypothetical protein [Turneriella sp.]